MISLSKRIFQFIFLNIYIASTVKSLKMSLWEASLKDIIVKNKRVVESKYISFTTISDGWPAARTVVFRGFHNQDDKVYLKFISDSRSQKIVDIEKCRNVELCWYLTKNKDQFRIRGHATSIGIHHADAKSLKLRIQSWNALSDGARTPFFFAGDPGDTVTDTQATLNEEIGKAISSEAKEKVQISKESQVQPALFPPRPHENRVNNPQSELGDSKDEEFNANIEPKLREKFVPVIPSPDVVKALREERKTGEEAPSKDTTPPPDCFNIILVDPLSVDHLQLGGNGHGQSRYFHSLDTLKGEKMKQWVVKRLNP
mmetsp:Transcript_6109/g.6267  ORF Transcript_6109/g.6267 Transcript_6109/m.6267 type:complete len:314 (-) Transcript_6109:844-1785(-)